MRSFAKSFLVLQLFIFLNGCDAIFDRIAFVEDKYYKDGTPEAADIVKEKVVLRGINEGLVQDGLVAILVERLRFTEHGLLEDLNRVVSVSNVLIPDQAEAHTLKIGATYEISATYAQTAWWGGCWDIVIPNHLFCTIRENRKWGNFPMALFSLTEIKEVP